MADLPAEWHEIERPGREDLDFFVSGEGGDRWDVFQIQSSAGAGLPLSGCTISAEMRTDEDNLLAILTAEFTDINTGMCRVSSTAAINAGMPGPDDVRTLAAPRFKLGRYAYFITDSVGRWCIKAGDAYGIRK